MVLTTIFESSAIYLNDNVKLFRRKWLNLWRLCVGEISRTNWIYHAFGFHGLSIM